MNHYTRPLTVGLVFAAALFRLVPHPANMAPIGALGLLSGGRLKGWQAFVMPLLSMAISDVALWGLFGNTPFNPFVYASTAIYVLLGRWMCQGISPVPIAAASLMGSLQFFLITNFSAWPLYPQTMEGLAECYIQGLPFFRNTVIGDLAFTAILFGLHAWLSQRLSPAVASPDR